jgi:cyclic-di-GMP phosphodiesterase, flagellum assembly factor TipF
VVVSPGLLREAVATAIATERVDLYLQPIALIPSRRVFAYDVSGRVRLKAGVYIPVRDFRGVAVHNGQMAQIDQLVIRQLAVQSEISVPVFMNLHASSLTHRGAMLELAQLIRKRPDLAQKLTVNLSQHDFNRLDEGQLRMIETLRHYGVGVGINDVTSPDVDMNRMTQYGFAFVKIAAGRLLQGVDAPSAAAALQRFMTRLQTRNIKLVVGGIESEAILKTLLDYPISLGQGYAIARPDRPVAFTKKVA